MTSGPFPIRILQNRDGEHLGFLHHLLAQGQDLRIISGYVRLSGLVALGPRFEELVMEGRVVLLSGSRSDQMSRQAIRWFEDRRRSEHILRVSPSFGFVHAKVWMLRTPGIPFLWTLIGSANLTASGLTRNLEMGAWFSSPVDSVPAQMLEQTFQELQQASEPASWHIDEYLDESVVGEDESAYTEGPYFAALAVRARQAEVGRSVWAVGKAEAAGGQAGVSGSPTAPASSDGLVPSRGSGAAAPDVRPPVPAGQRQNAGVHASYDGQPRSRDGESLRSARHVEAPVEVASAPASPLAPPPLQDFQEEAVARIRGARNGALRLGVPFSGVLNLPTGGGKTKVAVWWLLQDFVAAGKTVLWIAHRSELLDQAEETFAEHRGLLGGSPLRIARLDGSNKDIPPDTNVILASTQTLVNAPSLVKIRGAGLKVDCISYDEAHHALADETRRMLAKLRAWSEQQVPFLGLTATPFRANKGKTTFLEDLFGAQVIYTQTFGDLVQRGFLAEPVWRRLERDAYSRRVRLSTEDIANIQRQNEFTPDVLERVAHDDEWNRAILKKWVAERQTFGRSLLFACNIDHCERLARIATSSGVRARVITYHLQKDERRQLVADFKAGAYDLLINVAILTEGTDLPDVQTVVVARPTLSMVLHRQMIGRGARRGRDRAKTKFYVLDCVHNCLFHDVADLRLPGDGDWRD